MQRQNGAVEVKGVPAPALFEVRMLAVRPVTRTVQSLALLALPHGGQRVARQNAWAATSAEAAWARSRREAELAMHRSLTSHAASEDGCAPAARGF